MISLKSHVPSDESSLIPFILSFRRSHHAETDAANARGEIAGLPFRVHKF